MNYIAVTPITDFVGSSPLKGEAGWPLGQTEGVNLQSFYRAGETRFRLWG